VVNALLEFLWSDRAQKLFIESGFRSVHDRLNEQHEGFHGIADPFTASTLGGWDRAKKEIIDSIWKERVLKELRRKP
jgi:ABC-type sulfate transport system substrate-binding protein